MKRRLGIYIIYDEQDVICNTDLYLAREMKSVTSRLIVCINSRGNVNTQRLREYTKEIIVRDNLGFDAGAVKEVLCGYLEVGELQTYDELIISNNSFFGPFIPMRRIFDMMEERESDYWGLSGYAGEESIFWRGAGSYFWVFRRSVIKSHFLENFMNRYVDERTDDFMEVCGIYECRMNYELMQNFKLALFSDVGALNIFDAGDVAMMKYSLPILKRKFFTEKRTDSLRIRNALRFIADTGFDVRSVEEKLNRLYNITVSNDGEKWRLPSIEEKEYEIPKTDITYKQIEEFLEANPSVYVYGIGHFATFIWALFGEKYQSIKGFVTTDKMQTETFHGYCVGRLSDLRMSDSVLVALNAENTNEVKPGLEGRNCLFLHL